MLRREPVKDEALIDYKEIDFIKDASGKKKKLGAGGFGVVYHGIWRHNEAAIKQLLMKEISPEVEREFQTEAKVMARLRSPNIIQFYGYSMAPERCIVMEYCPNGSLYSVLHSDKPLDWSVRVNIALGAAKGIAFLHDEKILHRDIKSLNILLTKDLEAKVTDFGLSKIKAETRAHTVATKTQHAVGTLLWMAPELFNPEGIYTWKSDTYSLGVTFWELSSRKIPFENAANPMLVPMWIGQGKREEIPKDCPPRFGALIQQCWAGEPGKRPDIKDIITHLKELEKTIFVSAQKRHNAPSPNPSPKPLVFLGEAKLSPQPKKKELPQDPLIKTLKGHTEYIHGIQLLPSGKLVSVASDGLKFWDIETGECIKTLKGCRANCIQVLSTGELVGGVGDEIKVWDPVTGDILKTLEGHRQRITCLQPLPNGELVSGSADGKIKVWDVKAGTCLKTLQAARWVDVERTIDNGGTIDFVKAFQLLPNGLLLGGLYEEGIQVWDLKTGQCINRLPSSSFLSCFQMLMSGELITAGLYEFVVWKKDRKYDLWDKKPLIHGSNNKVSAFQQLPNSKLVSGLSDGGMKVWDLRTEKCLKTLAGHGDRVSGFQLLPNNKLVSGSWDKTIKVWDISEFSPAPVIEEKKAYVHF